MNQIQGVGLGLRSRHLDFISQRLPSVPWFEALTENYLGAKALPLAQLLSIAEHYPITLHGVGLSLGSAEPLSEHYLALLAELIAEVKPQWFSDHLCWCGLGQKRIPDLLPLPHHAAVIDLVVDKINRVQDRFGIPFLIENVSSYMTFSESCMPEWEFVNQVVDKADCGLLLDINNIYVSAKNHDFDPYYYVAQMPSARVMEYHLAGFSMKGEVYFDTHSQVVHPPVWDLYEYTLAKIGLQPTLIEWDQEIPAFECLEQERAKAQQIYERVACDLVE